MTKSFYIHTSNSSWLEEPNPFIHLKSRVKVKSDDKVSNYSWRLCHGKTSLTNHDLPINEKCMDEIRKRIAAHLKTI
jgi:hypothetical protein